MQTAGEPVSSSTLQSRVVPVLPQYYSTQRVELRPEGFSTVGVQALACLFDAQTQAKAWTPARVSSYGNRSSPISIVNSGSLAMLRPNVHTT